VHPAPVNVDLPVATGARMKTAVPGSAALTSWLTAPAVVSSEINTDLSLSAGASSASERDRHDRWDLFVPVLAETHDKQIVVTSY